MVIDFKEPDENSERDERKKLQIEQIISAGKEGILSARRKIEAKDSAESMHQQIANCLLDTGDSVSPVLKQYRENLSSLTQGAIVEEVDRVQPEIILNLQTPELCTMRNDALLKEILRLLEDGPENEEPRERAAQVVDNSLRPAQRQNPDELATQIDDAPPAISSVNAHDVSERPGANTTTDETATDNPFPPVASAQAEPVQKEIREPIAQVKVPYRPSGEDENVFFVPHPGDRQDMIDKRRNELKLEHAALREEYLNTPAEAFERKSGWLRSSLDKYIDMLGQCVNSEQSRDVVYQMNANLRAILQTSPLEQNPPAEIPARERRFRNEFHAREFPQQLTQILSLAEQQRETIIDAKHPLKAISALSRLESAIGQIGSDRLGGLSSSSNNRLRN